MASWAASAQEDLIPINTGRIGAEERLSIQPFFDLMDYTLIHTFSELEPFATDWNALLAESITHVPFLRHEYLRAWWATRGGGEWPQSELAVVLAHQGGHLKGIAPLFFTQNRESRPALMLLGSIEISDYLDLICRPLDLPAFLSGLLDFLSSARTDLPDWDLLDWQNVPEASPTSSCFRARLKNGAGPIAPSVPIMRLPSRWSGILTPT